MIAHRKQFTILTFFASALAFSSTCEFDLAPISSFDSCQPLSVTGNYGADINPEKFAFTLCLGRVNLSNGRQTTVLQMFQNGIAWNDPVYLKSFKRGPNNDFGQGSGHWTYSSIDQGSEIAVFPSNRLADVRVDQCDGIRSIHYSHSDWPYPGYISFSVGSHGGAMPCLHEGSLPVFSK
ncbi:hypothetical protein GW915_03320 [bacterium]|nr:hypothetical protein [bacterium]